nr:DNA/RNA nuclease SfsA [Caulobacter sp. BE254]
MRPRPNRDLARSFAACADNAAAAGVEVLCYRCDISPDEIRISRRIPWRDAPSV